MVSSTELAANIATTPSPQAVSPQGALGRKLLVELVDGGFDDLAGPLGGDAVQVGHIQQPARVAAVTKVELGGHKIALPPGWPPTLA